MNCAFYFSLIIFQLWRYSSFFMRTPWLSKISCCFPCMVKCMSCIVLVVYMTYLLVVNFLNFDAISSRCHDMLIKKLHQKVASNFLNFLYAFVLFGFLRKLVGIYIFRRKFKFVNASKWCKSHVGCTEILSLSSLGKKELVFPHMI